MVDMARGWESKEVESQQEMAAAERSGRNGNNAISQQDRDAQAKRDGILSTRTRVVSDLERARHPRHRQQLEMALAHLDAEIAQLG